VFRWDVGCGEILGIIQSQVIPWMGSFDKRVTVNFDENFTHGMCRTFNTYDCLICVKL